MKGMYICCALKGATLVLALVCGCTTVQVEYDRMTGTAFPASETVNSKTVTIPTPYAKAGILVVVKEDNTNIAPLSGPSDPSDPDQYDYITVAELETLEQANRSSPTSAVTWPCKFWIFTFTCTRHHVYGIVVDHYYESASGYRSTGVMGIMYDTNTRGAFANYHKNSTVSGNNAKYLRSAMHELGHAFNLEHCDGDGNKSIMNQTWAVGDSFIYEFSTASENHLQDCPRDHVWPGKSAFQSCPNSCSH